MMSLEIIFLKILGVYKYKQETEKFNNMNTREELEYIIKRGIVEDFYGRKISTIDGDVVISVDTIYLIIQIRIYYYDGNISPSIIFNINTSVDEIFKKVFPKEYRKEQLEKIKNI